MPKRPSSVAIGPDSQIICADKFGDVYALPLIETTSPSSTGTPQPSTPSLVVSKPAFKPAANATTVHSKRNLRALANQEKQMKLTTRSKNEPTAKSEGPDFDLTLLLGHVSMLTSLVLGESEGRRYILTADRDEHIRISRYIPQAYVIEGFCFGHKEFVSSMAIPNNRRHVLISGGGDEDIFVWDWKASKPLSQKSVLSLAQAILPDLTKVAVSGLRTFVYPTDAGELTYVVVICEE
jgi:tRNA (guanine-N(7)-)-methyltransferase subunit TRM82